MPWHDWHLALKIEAPSAADSAVDTETKVRSPDKATVRAKSVNRLYFENFLAISPTRHKKISSRT
jgi:hypothetical protein